MSEQIREQVSAFLDGELPDSETELLLKRLTRDGELRESFGRYALIGEAVRGGTSSLMTRGFAGRVNLAIDGEPIPANGYVPRSRAPRWWRPFAGAAVAAGVAAVAIVSVQHRAVAPGLRSGAVVTAQNAAARTQTSFLAQNAALSQGSLQTPREAISYTVPAASPAASAAIPPARLTKYVFAHSRYSSGLDQRGVLADLLIEAEDQQPPPQEAPPPVVPVP
jgi:sigma-E factor negative regulatory protein RseA